MILLHLTIANLKMRIRNRQAIFWAIAFPLIFVLVFGIFFRDRDSTATAAVIDYAGDDLSRRIQSELEQTEGLRLTTVDSEAQGRESVADGSISVLVILPEGLEATASANPPAQIGVVYDDANPFGGLVVAVIGSFVSRANLQIAQIQPALAIQPEGVTRQQISYFDFLMPGLAIWGVMSFSVIGLATTITTYREQKILLRIQATPLPVSVFFMAQVLAHLIISLVQVAIIMSIGVLIFGAEVRGNFLYLAIIVIIANLVFLNLGFIVAAYSRTVQAASGLGNAVVLPIMFFSGVFFPTDDLPVILKYAVDFLPLSPVMAATRGVVLEARPLLDFPIELATIAAWFVLSGLIAIRTFRFRNAG